MSQARRPRVASSTSYGVEPLERRSLLSTALALDANNRLLRFETEAPGTYTRAIEVTGLGSGESILAIDYRPATGQLYGLGSESRLYAIDTASGVATQVGSDFAIPLEGNAFDMDFNPAVDRIRVVSNTDQNLRLNPDTGAVVDFDTVAGGTQPDAELAFEAGDANVGDDPVVVAAAYDVNRFAATAPSLYALDSAANALVRIGSEGGTTTSPNTGQLFTVGTLGVDIGKRAAMDVVTEGETETAFAVLQPVGQVAPSLYTINLETGAATSVGSFGERRIVDVAVAPPPTIAFAVTASNELLAFRTNDPTNPLRRADIEGLDAGEVILGMDFRPATGELIAVSSEDRVYAVNPRSGRTTPIGSESFDVATQGAAFGIDFNPAVDRIRLVSDADLNLRLNPETGAAVDADPLGAGSQADDDLFYDDDDANVGANPDVGAAAYTGNDNDAATPTTLYGLDASLDALVRQGSVGGTPVSPNEGALFTVGELGVNVTNSAGFDVLTRDGIDEAYAALQRATGTSPAGLYRINLATGLATRMGSFGGGAAVTGLAVVPA